MRQIIIVKHAPNFDAFADNDYHVASCIDQNISYLISDSYHIHCV